ncbi:MAG: hypothetical protein AAF226_18650, partial [Verrucomicrobiota bacterium]
MKLTAFTLALGFLVFSGAIAQDDQPAEDPETMPSAARVPTPSLETSTSAPIITQSLGDPALDSLKKQLETHADRLSKRAKAIRDREQALRSEEEALRAREDELIEKEKELESKALMLQKREQFIRRREELPSPQVWRADEEAPSIYGRYAAVIDGQNMQFYHKKN